MRKKLKKSASDEGAVRDVRSPRYKVEWSLCLLLCGPVSCKLGRVSCPEDQSLQKTEGPQRRKEKVECFAVKSDRPRGRLCQANNNMMCFITNVRAVRLRYLPNRWPGLCGRQTTH